MIAIYRNNIIGQYNPKFTTNNQGELVTAHFTTQAKNNFSRLRLLSQHFFTNFTDGCQFFNRGILAMVSLGATLIEDKNRVVLTTMIERR